MELPHYSVTSVTLPIDAALHHIRLKFLVLSFVVPELIVSSVTVRTCIREVSGLNLGMYCFFWRLLSVCACAGTVPQS